MFWYNITRPSQPHSGVSGQAAEDTRCSLALGQHQAGGIAGAHADPDALRRGDGVGRGDQAVMVGAERVADARGLRRHRSGGDAVIVENRKPLDAGIVQPAPGVVADDAFGADRQGVKRHDLRPMRGDAEDILGMRPVDARERPAGVDLALGRRRHRMHRLVDESGEVAQPARRRLEHQPRRRFAGLARPHAERRRRRVAAAHMAGQERHAAREARLPRGDRRGGNAEALREGEAADAGLVLARSALMRDPRLDALAHGHGGGRRAGEGRAHRDGVGPRLMLEIAERIRDDDPAILAGVDVNRRLQPRDVHRHATFSLAARLPRLGAARSGPIFPAMIPFSVLDLSPIIEGGDAGQALRNTLDLARHAERWGYQRYWLAEHHNMAGIASAATAVVIGHVAAGTATIRVGAGGVMLGLNVFAAASDAEASRLFTSLQQAFVNLRRGRPGPLPPPVDDIAAVLSPLERAMVAQSLSCAVVGSPETARRGLDAFIARTGADEIMITAQIFDHAARLRSFEIAAAARAALAGAAQGAAAG